MPKFEAEYFTRAASRDQGPIICSIVRVCVLCVCVYIYPSPERGSA